MVAPFPLQGMKPYLVPAVAVLAGLGVAIGIATAPSDTLNGALDRTGIAALVPAAASPIGVTGRTLLALALGSFVALLGVIGRWRAVLEMVTPSAVRAVGDAEAPLVVRRADAHPDAPPRRPIRASADLGDPLPMAVKPAKARRAAVPAAPPQEQPLPVDLDLPLSAFDPEALPATPLEPVRPVSALVRSEAGAREPSARTMPWLEGYDARPSELPVPTAAAMPIVAEERLPLPVAPEKATSDANTPIAKDVTEAQPAPLEAPSPTPASQTPVATPLPIRLGREPDTSPRVIEAPAPVAIPAKIAHAPEERTPPRPMAVPSSRETVAPATPPLDEAIAQAGADEQSISTLLARLEAVAARRAAAVSTPPVAAASPLPEDLDATLQSLRQLAAK